MVKETSKLESLSPVYKLTRETVFLDTHNTQLLAVAQIPGYRTREATPPGKPRL